MLSSLVASNRSCRAFDRTDPIPRETLLSLIDRARQSASGKNLQPLRYRVLTLETDIFKMLRNCRFAPSLNIPLPPAGKEPTGFILIFSDNRVASPEPLRLIDVGIAAQTILLSAAEKGFGGCMLKSFDAGRLSADFGIPAYYTPQLAIALGKPAERAHIKEAVDGNTAYYRENGVQIVPKLPLSDILI